MCKGTRTAIKSKIVHAYKIAYLKCTLNLYEVKFKKEAFSLNKKRRKRRPKLVSKSAIYHRAEILRNTKFSLFRNVAILTTQHAITRSVEFQET